MWSIISYNLNIAIEAISQNRLRALLTSLGIVFGVASVIAMLAIGSGAQQQILEQMKTLGTNNILIQPVVEQEEGSIGEEESQDQGVSKTFTPGLTLRDMESIQSVVSSVKMASPELLSDELFIRKGFKKTGKLVGVHKEYFNISAVELLRGTYFDDKQYNRSMPVAIIGKRVQDIFFAGENPMGKSIKVGSNWFTVIGVLESRTANGETLKRLGIRDYDMDIYTPATSYLIRHKNRALVTSQDIKRANSGDADDNSNESNNYHQVDRIILQVSESEYIRSTADVVARMLERRHNGVIDFEIIIPELLLQQEQQTKQIFNIVLSSIASISLLVGGIGIMNIMFASVVERYREIGTRMAIGARKLDIKLQFVTESLLISLTGGILGILLGVGLSYVIEQLTEIKTLVTFMSVVISFGVSISVGLVFGIFPAIKASDQEPADVLRYE